MRLRKLTHKDAPLMLEWMHDADVTEDLAADFSKKTLEDCFQFIDCAQDTDNDLHLAIVDERDEYLGTVSLKHINQEKRMAEFAITIRRKAMGTGISKIAMQETLAFGFEKLGLQNIYWCVDEKNVRAIRFYNKNNYKIVQKGPREFADFYSPDKLKNLIWYQVSH